MDAIDRKILAVLQEDASLSVADIGSRVGLSSTPCWKRIQRLEADGVILKRVALVDQERIGLGITVFVSVETGDHSQDWLDRFAKVVGAMPVVNHFLDRLRVDDTLASHLGPADPRWTRPRPLGCSSST